MPNVVTGSSVRSQLMEANKDYYGRNTWEQAFGQVRIAQDRAMSQLDKSYGDAMSQAYAASLQQQNAIQASGLGQGFKSALQSQNEASLDDAFKSYRESYLSSKAEVDSSTNEAIAQINSAIDEQANNVAAYTNAAFDYLPWLYENHKDVFENDPALSRYLVYETNDDGTKTATGVQDLRATMFSMDENGQPVLNDAGLDFFNFVQNYGATGNLGGKTFTDYLHNSSSSSNKKILEWLSSPDPYSSGKLNSDTVNEILGLDKNAGPYQLTRESFTDDQWSNVTGDYEVSHKTLIDEYNKGHKSEEDAKSFMGKQRTETEKLLSLAESLGVYDEVKDLADKVKKNLDTYDDTVENPGKGNNRSNREWATSNALADYEELYEAVMKAYDSVGFETSTERSNYRVSNRLMSDYDAGKISADEYNKELSKMVSLRDDDDLAVNRYVNAGDVSGGMIIDYSLSGEGNETIDVSWDAHSPVKSGRRGTGFRSIKSYSRRESGLDSYNKYEIGVLPNGDAAVKYNGNVYKLKYNNTKHNRMFIDYLKTFNPSK